MTYDQLVTYLTGLVVTANDDAEFATILPAVINYAEERIYRELDFLQTRESQSGPPLTPGSRNVSLAGLSNPEIVVEQVNIITPATASPDSGRRNPLTPQSKPYMDLMYPSGGVPGSPQVPVDFAMVDAQSFIVGPVADAAYGVEVFGTIRPEELSASNQTTWLATNLPDLYTAACMVFISGWMKNYAGALSDDPQQPINWEQQYKTLKESAMTEESRRKFQSVSWSSQQPQPTSTPPRA